MKKLYTLFIAFVPILTWAQTTWNFGTIAPGSASPSSGGTIANITAIADVSAGNNNGSPALLSTTSASSTYTGASGSFNAGAAARTGVLNTAAAGSAYFEFTFTPASNYSVKITEIDFGTRSTSTGPQAYTIRSSADNFGSDIATGAIVVSGTPWALKTNAINLTGPAGTALTIRIYGYNGTGSPAAGTVNWRIDDLSVTAAAISSGGSSASVTINSTGLTGFSTTVGTASAAQTISIGGSNLTGDISITPPTPYEISTDGGANYSAATLTLTQTGGNVASTPVKIRIASGAPAGAANGNIVVSTPGATDQTVALTGTVNSAITVNPPASFSASAISATEIDLTGAGNAAADNIIVATNSTASFGTPSGALTTGNTISGGGTVLYNGPSAGFSFAHTGLTGATTYYYKAWSVDGSNNYSATGLTANATTATATAPAANIVINQVYGGGGNSGATFKNDFIELYNNENTAVDLSGWSLQYGGPTGTGNLTVHALSGIIQPHNFFLVQEAAGTGGSVNLPTPDATGTLALGATGGKVILSNSVAQLSGANPTGAAIMDKVGYGSANGYETSPAAATDNTTSVTRITDGVDNNNNATDFAVTPPVPRNSTYKTTAPAIVSLTPANGSANIPHTIPLSVIFDKKIVKGAGTITIYENGIAGTALDVNDAGVVISNNSSVAIPSALTGGKSYYVLISAGAFKDVYNNDFAGISSPAAWAFTTYNDAVATTIPVSYDFQNCSGNGLLPGGFTQYNTTGAQIWDCTSFGRDPNAPAGTAAFPNSVQINGFSNGINNINKDWLISPKLDLTGTTYPLLNFWSRNAFAGDPLELKISTDYAGSGDPALATWTDLNGRFPSKGSDVWTLSSGINLSAFKQSSVYIAFVYSSTTDDGSRWTLDDISLDNSLTPPPPSLTLSATNLEYGYTASGSNSTKTITVTANDLVGDITLTATGNFQVSTDNISFGPSATITQAVANNVPQLVYVRFAPAINNVQYSETLSVSISDSTGIIMLKGNSIDPASTLNVVNWNLNWFAIPVIPGVTDGLGPVNKSLQQDNVATILKTIPADLFVLQEVVNQHALDSIVNTMPGFAYKINDYGSYSNPTIANPNPLTVVQKLAFVYKTSKFSNVHTDSLLSKGVTLGIDTLNPYYNAFASGRFPYMMTADVTLSDNNGGFITHQMRFINIHAKANTAPVVTAYNRRLAGAKGLDSLIKADYISDNVIILGDFNDDLNQTITAGITPPVSSYSPFTVDDSGLYVFPTKPLSPAGQHSDVNFTSVIDNVVATAVTNKYYLPSSATVLSDVANVVPKYGTTTTDHYPIFSQFSFSTAAALPVKLLNFSAVKQNELVKLTWSTTLEENSRLFDVERSVNGINFTKIGTVAAKGFSSVKTDYIFDDKQPAAGLNYYRLKQVDLDGKYTYSAVVKVNFARQAGIRITPNPASTYIYVSLENVNTTAKLQVIDLNGQLLRQEIINQNTATTTISLAGLAKGLYTVKLVTAEKVTAQKLVIQ